VTTTGPLAVPGRGIGVRTLAALFLALVAAILGATPGWKMCYAAWLVLSWAALGCVLVASAFVAMLRTMALDFAALRAEGRQILNVGLLMLAMLPMAWLSTLVEFVQARPILRAQADASARLGGPRLAMTASEAEWPLSNDGFVYDVDETLRKPPSQRPAAWADNPALVTLSGECVAVTHLVGHYYRWSAGCSRF